MRGREVGTHEKRALLLHQAELIVGQFKAVFDRIGAAPNHVVRCRASVDMDGNRAPSVVRFLDGNLNVIFRIVKHAVVRYQLDDVGTVIDIFMDCAADGVGRIRVEIFALPELALLRWNMARLSTERPNDLAGTLHGGTIEPTLFQSGLQIRACVISFVANFTNGGESCLQDDLAIVEAAKGAEGRAFLDIGSFEWRLAGNFREREMRVSIHQAGHHPFFGKINDLSVFWNGKAGANSGDFAVFDEDDLILADGAFGGIKQIPGADRDRLRGSRQNEKN